ncbi:hypothetical protein PMI06_009003 [Burkholderia sp. BT03]|nr:hypothetical protein PMI06_009003 [Burkholderia sp. BT03]SKC55713.1 Alpha/beta hydrolase family protein [Paraburkholderia hospita]
MVDPSTQDATANYKLLIGSILPRAIAWVSTLSQDGVANLAPISFFTAVGRKSPMVSISMQPRSDGVTLNGHRRPEDSRPPRRRIHGRAERVHDAARPTGAHAIAKKQNRPARRVRGRLLADRRGELVCFRRDALIFERPDNFGRQGIHMKPTHPTQPALVFIHGFLDGADAWSDLALRLGDRAAGALRVDLPGMGARAGEPGPYSLDRFAADVTTQVRALSRPVVLVGHSMGAQIAELVAQRLDEQVRGVVLLTPVPLRGTGLPDDAMRSFHALGGNPAAQRELRRNLSVKPDDAQLDRRRCKSHRKDGRVRSSTSPRTRSPTRSRRTSCSR